MSIEGTAREGETLLASLGGWSPPSGASLSRQWSRCNGQGQGCAEIAGARAERYVATFETHYPSLGGNDYSYVDSTALTVFYCPP